MIGQSCYQISKLYVNYAQAELHNLKVEKLDACTRFLFTNLVTYDYAYTSANPNLLLLCASKSGT